MHAPTVSDPAYVPFRPARYPDSHPEGAPFEHFGPFQSRDALDHARAIVEFVRDALA